MRNRAVVSTSQARVMGETTKGDASSSNPSEGGKGVFSIAGMKSKAKADLLADSPGMVCCILYLSRVILLIGGKSMCPHPSKKAPMIRLPD